MQCCEMLRVKINYFLPCDASAICCRPVSVCLSVVRSRCSVETNGQITLGFGMKVFCDLSDTENSGTSKIRAHSL